MHRQPTRKTAVWSGKQVAGSDVRTHATHAFELGRLDGAELGLTIRDHPGDIEVALAAYERALFPRSASIARQTASKHRRFFGESALRSVVELFAGH